MSKRKEIAAYHEAGHAVAHVLLGVPFDYVTIIPNENSGGHVASRRPRSIVRKWNEGDRDNPALRDYIERELIITLAGHTAQRKMFPRSQWQEGFGSGEHIIAPGSDLQTATRIIADLFGDDDGVRRTYQAFVQERTRQIINGNWPRVVAAAAALLERERLTSSEATFAMYPELAPLARNQ